MSDYIENSLIEILSFTLGRKGIARSDNFFSVGGDSLLALATIEQIKQRLGWNLTLADFLRNPTVADLVAHGPRARVNNDQRPIIRMSNRGEKVPIIFIHPESGLVFSYSKLVHELGKNRACYGIQSPTLTGETDPGTIEEVADRYAEMIFDEFGEDEFHLIGWSMGGLIAYEIARRASDRGLGLKKLVLIDSYIWESPSQVRSEETLLRDFRNDLMKQMHPEESSVPSLDSDTTKDAVVNEVAAALFGQPENTNNSKAKILVTLLFESYSARVIALSKYRPTSELVNGLLLHSPDNDSISAWEKFSESALVSKPIACNHYGLLQVQHASVIAIQIEDYLL